MTEGSQDIESKARFQSVQGCDREQAEQINTRVIDATGGDSGSMSASSNDNKKISREDIELVWQKLEEENSEFFRAYYIRLKLKKQINLFNHLLEHQYNLMNYPVPQQLPFAPMPNGVRPMSGLEMRPSCGVWKEPKGFVTYGHDWFVGLWLLLSLFFGDFLLYWSCPSKGL